MLAIMSVVVRVAGSRLLRTFVDEASGDTVFLFDRWLTVSATPAGEAVCCSPFGGEQVALKGDDELSREKLEAATREFLARLPFVMGRISYLHLQAKIGVICRLEVDLRWKSNCVAKEKMLGEMPRAAVAVEYSDIAGR